MNATFKIKFRFNFLLQEVTSLDALISLSVFLFVCICNYAKSNVLNDSFFNYCWPDQKKVIKSWSWNDLDYTVDIRKYPFFSCPIFIDFFGEITIWGLGLPWQRSVLLKCFLVFVVINFTGHVT